MHFITACPSVSFILVFPINDFCLPDVQSCELVEKLLSDLLTTTEGYHKLKNTIEILKHDDNLNQQSLVPL